MARSPISRLPKSKRREFLDDLNYLNTAEIKTFCRRHLIPYSVVVGTKDGEKRKTQEDDRKGVMLERVRHFLRTGAILPETCFAASVVCFDAPPEELTANDKLLYGQYEKTNHNLMVLLKDLTDGNFRDGAVARILMREFWTQGKAPTFREFASAWLQASNEYTKPKPEWAFLSDRAKGIADRGWKKMRVKKAARVVKILKQIAGGGGNSKQSCASK